MIDGDVIHAFQSRQGLGAQVLIEHRAAWAFVHELVSGNRDYKYVTFILCRL